MNSSSNEALVILLLKSFEIMQEQLALERNGKPPKDLVQEVLEAGAFGVYMLVKTKVNEGKFSK